ncbi:hypothetical protein Vretifemale_9703 [Volvox reticuliferus]|uniref:Uncharacterized protein n=1 Tax=Volvox reticuliferus TaxID=1737510 RepID=A0A8J4CD74_9CHLO|nr:hypothetical protein Vretifemale_9703 [Volvox reticuliferus]
MWGCWFLPVVFFAPTSQSQLRPNLPLVVTKSILGRPLSKMGSFRTSSYGNKGVAIGNPSGPQRRVKAPPSQHTFPSNGPVLPASYAICNEAGRVEQNSPVGLWQQKSGERGVARRNAMTGIRQRGAAQNEWLDGAATVASVGGRHSYHMDRATIFLVQSIRTWGEAAQFLDVTGGQDGCPPPRLQLELLLQSRLFRTSVGVPGVITGAAESRLGSLGRGEAAACGEKEAQRKQRAQGGNLLAVSDTSAPFDVQDAFLWPSDDERSNALKYFSAGDPLSSLHPPQLFQAYNGREAMAWAPHSTFGTDATVAATAAADDASWEAHWELEWEVQVQRHAPCLLEPSPWALPASPVSPQSQPCSGALFQELPQAAMRTCAAVMLPGHFAAASEATPSDMAMPSVGPAPGLNRYCPIPPMRTLGARPTPGLAPPTNTTANARPLMRKNNSNQKQGKGQLPPPPRQKQVALPEPAPEQCVGFSSGLAFGVASAAHNADDIALAAEVLLRVVYDAAVKRSHAWTNEEVATLLRRATKIAYRYPCLLSVQSDRQAPVDYKPPQVGTAPAPLPTQRPLYRRNIAVGISSGVIQSPGVPPLQASTNLSSQSVRIPTSNSGTGSLRESTVSASGLRHPAVGAELRVWLQQLLLRVDGMLMPNRSELRAQVGHQNASPGAVAAVPRRGSSQFVSARAVARRSGLKSEDVTDAVPAIPTDEELPPLTVSAAVWAVRAAAALQLRLSPEGAVRLRLLGELRTRRLSHTARRQQSQLRTETPRMHTLEEPQPQLRSYFEQRPQRERSQPHRGQMLGHRLETSGRARVSARRELRGISSNTRLNSSDAADMLWAFAMLGWQMPRFKLDRALRIVSESSPRRLVLRPTRLLGTPVKIDSASPGAPTTDSVFRTTTCTQSRTSPTAELAGVEGERDEDARAIGGRIRNSDGRDGVGGGGGRLIPRGLSGLKPSQLTGVAWAAVQLSEALGQEGVTGVWAAQLFAATQTMLYRFR